MPHSSEVSHHNQVISETMLVSWRFFLADFGLPPEETQVEFLDLSSPIKIKFHPKVVRMFKETFNELHCCGKGCKINMEFLEDTVVVHEKNFSMATAGIQFLIGSIAIEIKKQKREERKSRKGQ